MPLQKQTVSSVMDYVSNFLLTILTSITLYLVKVLLAVDKKVEVLDVEIKHLKDKLKKCKDDVNT
jgi:hypothetical protein